MIRWLMSFALALALAVHPGHTAEPEGVKLASVDIDLSKVGSKTIDLPAVKVSHLQLTADKAFTLVKVTTAEGRSLILSPLALKPDEASRAIFVGDEANLRSIVISWTIVSGPSQPVHINVTGQAAQSEGNRNLEKKSGNRGFGAPQSDRTVGAPPPPPAPKSGAEAPAPRSLPPVVDSAAAKPNACTDAKLCTIVDVFFGTDRNRVNGPERITFGSERPDVMTLGHAFVTVPKARATGTIPIPSAWDKYVLGVPPEGDPARHFTIPKNGIEVYTSETEFLAAAKKHIAGAGDFADHAFIFIHGFYVSFDDALFRTAQISYDLAPDGKPFGTAFLYSWPSLGDPRAYLYDGDSARGAVKHLQSFIRTVVDKTGVANVHIIAHSMGNVALIDALGQLAAVPTKAKINQIILAAPDYDKQLFERTAIGVSRIAKGVTLYASQKDNALKLSRQAYSGAPRAGDSLVPPGPAIVDGIETIDISAINSGAFWGHDLYADSPELLKDIATMFIKGAHPPTVRNPNFKLLTQGNLKYWQYAK